MEQELTHFIAAKIKEHRLKYAFGKGLSQAELAEKVGTTANTISRWETGVYKPSIEELEKICLALEISIIEMFPTENTGKNEKIEVLLRTAQKLSEDDLEELQAYAELRKTRSLSKNNKKKGKA